MELGFTPTVIRYTGLRAESHVLDAEELGNSLIGFSKTSNSLVHFYWSGQVTKRSESFDIRYMVKPPKDGSFIIEVVPYIRDGMLPIIAGPLAQFGNEVVSALWGAVVDKILGRGSDMEKALSVIDNMSKQNTELAKMAMDGHMQDKAWMKEKIDQLIDANRNAIRQLPAPVGNSCSQQMIGQGTQISTLIDEPDAEVLRSSGEVEIGAPKVYRAQFTALSTTTGAGRAHIDGSEEEMHIKVTDPAVMTPKNIYSKSLHEAATIKITAKPMIVNSIIKKLFVSDASAK